MDPWIINPNDLNEEFRMCTYPSVIPNRYAISNRGNIWNIKTRTFAGLTQDPHGYYTSNLKQSDGSFKSIKNHRLVAWEFVPYRRNIDLHINHIDGVKTNNSYTNLEWVTPAENTRHAWNNNLMPSHVGIHNSYHKLTEEDVHFICRVGEDANITSSQIAEMLNNNVSPSVIRDILRGARWTHISCNYNIPQRNMHYISSRIKGEDHSRSKLTEDDVRLILELLQNPHNTIPYIASKLNNKVSKDTIAHIVHRHNWTHISSEYDIPPRQRPYNR